MDEVDPNDLLIGVVQIPPGADSKQLCDASRPETAKFLRKFFKRMHQKPGRAFSKPLPSSDAGGIPRYMLTAMQWDDANGPASSSHCIPFAVKNADESWCLRHLPALRLAIQVCSTGDAYVPWRIIIIICIWSWLFVRSKWGCCLLSCTFIYYSRFVVDYG